MDDGGAGYIHTPVVRLSGGVGSGATAVANITGGVITGITITNPGSGYAPDDVLFASIMGGGATTPATLGTISLAANNTTGGLSKQGAGTLTLSGTNAYAGTTTVSAGMALDATGSINTSSGITINGATASCSILTRRHPSRRRSRSPTVRSTASARSIPSLSAMAPAAWSPTAMAAPESDHRNALLQRRRLGEHQRRALLESPRAA